MLGEIRGLRYKNRFSGKTDYLRIFSRELIPCMIYTGFSYRESEDGMEVQCSVICEMMIDSEKPLFCSLLAELSHSK